MQLLKNRDFGDYFSDTFQFFKENFKGLILNFFKLQGIPFILLIIAGYFYGNMMSEQVANGMMDYDTSDPEAAAAQMGQIMATYLSAPFLILMILGCISSIISANYIPIYMELYRTNQGDISFSDIINKFKENGNQILILTLVLILLFIPIYIAFAIVFFISLFTIIGWIFVLGFCVSYFSLIWFDANYYKSGGFKTLGNTLTLFKGNFFKITGATTILLFIFMLIYYIILIGVMMLAAGSESLIESMLSNPAAIYSEEMIVAITIMQTIGLIIGTAITLLIQIQQGVIFYSRINEIEQVSEYEDINSIGEDDSEPDHSSYIQNH